MGLVKKEGTVPLADFSARAAADARKKIHDISPELIAQNEAMVKSIVDILLSHQGEKNFPILKLKIRQPPSRGYQLKSHLIKSISPLIPPSEKFNFPHLEITTMNDGVEQVTTVVASGFLHQIGVVDQDMKTRALVLTKFGQELVERYTKE